MSLFGQLKKAIIFTKKIVDKAQKPYSFHFVRFVNGKNSDTLQKFVFCLLELKSKVIFAFIYTEFFLRKPLPKVKNVEHDMNGRIRSFALIKFEIIILPLTFEWDFRSTSFWNSFYLYNTINIVSGFRKQYTITFIRFNEHAEFIQNFKIIFVFCENFKF